MVELFSGRDAWIGGSCKLGRGVPLSWGLKGGGHLRTSAEVILGKVVRKPASIARQRIDKAGDPIAACRNAIPWPMVAWGCRGWRCILCYVQRQRRMSTCCVMMGVEARLSKVGTRRIAFLGVPFLRFRIW